ncbi:MAG TPA: hypothetical protein VLA19_09465 [Herpetosiphonaceae bacterium]|nr:hypothetical protein [Herpetosiphonaceae bacterium]
MIPASGALSRYLRDIGGALATGAPGSTRQGIGLVVGRAEAPGGRVGNFPGQFWNCALLDSCVIDNLCNPADLLKRKGS